MALVGTSKADFMVGERYRLVRKIGSGSFGDIYLAINITNGEVCATITVLLIALVLLNRVRFVSEHSRKEETA